MTKSLDNLKKITITAVLSTIAFGVAGSALAQSSTSTVSVTGQFGIGAVYDASEIAMAPLPNNASDLNYAGNAAFFEGKKLCLAGRDGNWPIKRDGTIENSPRQPARRPVCTSIVNGRATLANPFGRNADAFIADDDVTRIIAWAADDSLTPGYHN